MAFATTTEWDVRTTGADANGGGFNTASAGTDYSQQDAAQVTYTDLVIDATTNTNCTSAATPFTSAHVGNIINITSGTGFTVQRVQVVSVAASVATCDKSLGTLSSTGGNGKLGGALASPITALNAAASKNTVHIKSGTYTLTSSGTVSSGDLGSAQIIGYNTTHNDGGTKPLITTATNSVHLFNLNTSGGVDRIQFVNLQMTNTAATRFDAIHASAGLNVLVVKDCIIDGCRIGINGDNASYDNYFSSVTVSGTEIKNCTIDGVRNRGGFIVIQGCYIHNQTSHGVYSDNLSVTAIDSIFAANGGDGVNSNGAQVFNCTFASNTGDGVESGAGNLLAINCIFYGQTGYGLNGTGVTLLRLGRNNAFGSNTAGNANNVGTGSNVVTLTATPFTASGSGDYSLNSTAGGGALCKAAGFPGAFAGGTTTGYLDIGAAQVQAGAAGGGGAFTFIG